MLGCSLVFAGEQLQNLYYMKYNNIITKKFYSKKSYSSHDPYSYSFIYYSYMIAEKVSLFSNFVQRIIV